MQCETIQTLKNKKEFDFVYKHSNKYRNSMFDICILETKAIDVFCMKFKKLKNINIVGFSVSKKIGKAVERNLIKRRLKAICRDFLKNYKRFIFIIIAKSNIKQIPFAQLKKHICDTLSLGCSK